MEKLIKAFSNGQWTMDETLEKAWGTANRPTKTSGSGWSFKHTSAVNTGDYTLHTFTAHHNGKPLGEVHARHESDDIHASAAKLGQGGKLDHEASTHLQNHIDANHDAYVKMKKH